MRYVVLFLVVLLFVLQQDYWQWDNRALVFGFLPYSMAYHIGICLAAAGVGWMATRYCWPPELSDEASDEARAGDPRHGGSQP